MIKKKIRSFALSHKKEQYMITDCISVFRIKRMTEKAADHLRDKGFVVTIY